MPPKAKLKKEVETNVIIKKKPGRKPKATAIEPKIDKKQQTLNFSPKPVGIGSTTSANSHIGRSVGLTIYSSIYFDGYSKIENSNWAILPPNVLDRFVNELSSNNACFKIIGPCNSEIHVCALEFTAEANTIIVSTELLDILGIEPGNNIVATLVDPPQASNMRLMPLDKQFFDVEDTLDLLETSIKNYYKVLVEGQIIECRYFDIMIKMKIESLEPYYVCRTNETDLNIDFVENPKFIEKQEPIKETNTGSSWDSETVVNNEDSYFSKLGKGNSIISETNPAILSADEIRKKRLERLSTK